MKEVESLSLKLLFLNILGDFKSIVFTGKYIELWRFFNSVGPLKVIFHLLGQIIIEISLTDFSISTERVKGLG